MIEDKFHTKVYSCTSNGKYITVEDNRLKFCQPYKLPSIYHAALKYFTNIKDDDMIEKVWLKNNFPHKIICLYK